MQVDSLVVGGGPGGLDGRGLPRAFQAQRRLVDAHASRASLIVRSHNYPGFPEGIAGNDLLSRLRAQALRYGEKIIEMTVDSIARRQSGEFATDCGCTCADLDSPLESGRRRVERRWYYPIPRSNPGLFATGYHDWSEGCQWSDLTRCFWPNLAFGVPAGSLSPSSLVAWRFSDFRTARDTVMEETLRQTAPLIAASEQR